MKGNESTMTESTSNRLIGETSPYLLQHASNPVDWFPWGEEAFEKARTEDKPIFLSVGYSACHWCHVMAHECFEDIEIALALRRDFISIKVDREERPDIDAVYMRACEAMTGNGGWPLSVFLDAKGRPFHAGTYYPKETFLRLLGAVADAWKSDRTTLLRDAARLTALIGKEEASNRPSVKMEVEKSVALFRRRFDDEYGGFGTAPKFPAPHNLMFLLKTAPEMAEKTLVCMYRGGLFDHIGGGFSRYSTDRRWLVPHFEKMLYDNALLAMACLLAYEETHNPFYSMVARRVFRYLERDLSVPGGGFYCAQDADSEGEEGKFYLFTPQEIESALDAANAALFCRRYDITAHGNFEGGNIPNLIRSGEIDDTMDDLLETLYLYRSRRTPPHTDAKRLTGWNALAAAAYAMGARILKDEALFARAQDTLSFIERDLCEGARVFVGTAGGRRGAPGFLTDYAFYSWALIEAYEATLDEHFLARAAEITREVHDLFGDVEHGGYFLSGKANETLVARMKETYDGAMPSGNAAMAYVLSRLSLLLDDDDFRVWSEAQTTFMNGATAAFPAGCGFFLYASLPVKQIVCATNDPAEARALPIRSDWALRLAADERYPIIDGKTTYYVCEGKTCRAPVHAL